MAQVEALDPFESDEEIWILRETRRPAGWGSSPEAPTVFLGPMYDRARAISTCRGLNEAGNKHGIYYIPMQRIVEEPDQAGEPSR